MHCWSRFVAAIALAFCAVLISVATARATNFTWTDLSGGSFSDSGNWSPAGGPPSASDAANFNQNATYVVTIDSNKSNGDFTFSAGNVTFGGLLGSTPSYRISGVGGQNMVLTGGELTLGQQIAFPVILNFPVDVLVGNELEIRGGATLNVQHGSGLIAEQLLLSSDLFNPSNGTLIVEDVGSELTLGVAPGSGTHNIGAFGTGLLGFQNGATGIIGDTLSIGSVGAGGSGGGTLSVIGNSELTTQSINLGGGVGTNGTLIVGGTDSVLTQTGASFLSIGGPAGTGFGVAHIVDQAKLETGTGQVTIHPTGVLNAANGFVNLNGDVLIDGGVLNGPGAKFFGGQSLTIENSGQATVSFLQIGFMNPDTSIDIEVNSGGSLEATGCICFNTGSGTQTLVVDGSTSSLTVSGAIGLVLGVNVAGTRTATIRNNATATITKLRVADNASINSASTVEFHVESGANVTVGDVGILTGLVGVGATATMTVTGMNSTVTQNSGASLKVGDANDGTGFLEITDEGTFVTATGGGTTSIGPSGILHLESGGGLESHNNVENHGTIEMDFGSGSVGQVILGSGAQLTNHADGLITGNGLIDADTLPVLNMGTVAPGISTGDIVIGGDYSQTASGLLEIEIGGLVAGLEHDQLVLVDQSTADLSGTLSVTLLEGFMPMLGYQFIVVDTARDPIPGMVVGDFDLFVLPLLDTGLVWETTNAGDQYILGVVAGFAADFDEDDDVDGNDLALWEAGYGTSGTAVHMDGDADGDLDVDGADFLIWQQQLGLALPITAASAAVPEPATGSLLLMGLAGIGILTSRRHRYELLGGEIHPQVSSVYCTAKCGPI